MDFIVHVSSHFHQSTLHCSCFISFLSAHTSLFMLHFISFSPQSISFISSTIYSISFTFILIGGTHITWSFNLIVSFTFQPIPFLEINDLKVSLDKASVLEKYSLLEDGLWWFYYSLPLYVEQEIQHLQFYSNIFFV